MTQEPPPEDLRRRLATVQALLAGAPDPVVLVDAWGLVREANPAACALLPMLRAGSALSYGLRAPEILDAVAAARPGRPAHVEYRPRFPAERSFEVRIEALAAGGQAGPDPGVMLFFRDLTAARRLERMRVDFVANVSHELRTPLASLIGFIETLQGPARDDPAARARFLAIMREQAWRMTRLIDDLLSLSRIEFAEHLQPEAEVALGPLVRQMADALAPLAVERGATLALAGTDEPHPVRGDRDELLRLVENLVENALKYGRAGGRVEVSVRARPTEDQPPKVELTVRDNGPGIAPEHLPRLTERFYRVDVAESRERGGTGLGLALVKHIVARHRGRLAIESRPGEGAVFRVLLPAAGAGPAMPAETPG